MAQTDRIIVHWMESSRAQRIVWLLEELDLEYELKVQPRVNNRPPKDFKHVHALGKLPVVEILAPGKPKVVLAESGHIISYLIAKYDRTNRFAPANDRDAEMIDYYLYYSEPQLQSYLVGLFVSNIVKQSVPFGFYYLASFGLNLLAKYYYVPEIIKSLKFLNDSFAETASGDSGFAVGGKLTAADFMLVFPVAVNVFGNPEKAKALLGGNVDLKTKFPELAAYAAKIVQQPKFIKANEASDLALKELKSQRDESAK